MYGKMQESGPTEIIPFKCTSAIWTHSPVFLDFPGDSVVKNLPADAGDTGDMVQSLGWEDPLEWEVANHSSILAWKVSWIEEPGGLQFATHWAAKS